MPVAKPMSTEILTLTPLSAKLAVPDAVRKQRDELLARAKRGSKVDSAQSAERATALLREVKDFTALIEASRKAVKEEPYQLCKKIDALAADLADALAAESRRISSLIGAWTAEQERAAEEARRKAWEEEERIKREAAQKIKDAEALSQTATAAAVLTEKIEAKAVEAIVQVRTTAGNIVAAKPEGVSNRKVVKFEVTDIHALYGAAPYLVKLEPNTAALNNAIKSLADGQHIPGVRHWFEHSVSVR